MNYLYKTSKMLYCFIGLLVCSLIFCLLIYQAPPKKTPVSSKPTASTLTNPQYILEQSQAISTSGKIIYGKSGQGVNLICEKIEPVKPVKAKILLTFEIHGFEGLAPKDGQVLVNMANFIINYFAAHRNLLNNCQLYIVASANPDGLAHGTTANGIGRCQVSLGVDINRDFSYYFTTNSDSTFHTLSQPFAAPESRALRDLVDSLRPNVVIDNHGWDNEFLGNSELADCYKTSLQITNQFDFNSGNDGYFSAWAGTQGAKSMLIEYPPNAYYNSGIYENKTIAGINNLVNMLSR